MGDILKMNVQYKGEVIERIQCANMKFNFKINKLMHCPGIIEEIAYLFKDVPTKVLDLGCGPNSWTYPKYKVTSVDSDSYPDFDIDKTNRLSFDINQTFPLKDKSYDIILCIELIEHLENPWHLVRECIRVLKPNGNLFITTPDIESIAQRQTYLKDGNFKFFSSDDMNDLMPHRSHITPIFSWQMEKICRINKLSYIFKKHCFGGWESNIYWIRKNNNFAVDKHWFDNNIFKSTYKL